MNTLVWERHANTISGNLTVDTNTLFVDAASNRVGIGMNNPSVALDVSGDIVSKTGVFYSYRASKNIGANVTSASFTLSELGNPVAGTYFFNIIRNDTNSGWRLGGIIGIGGNTIVGGTGTAFNSVSTLYNNQISYTSITGSPATGFNYNPATGAYPDAYIMTLIRIG